jgi:hypothetical protein
MNIWYDLNCFQYDKDTRTLRANEERLYPIEPNVHCPFPNGPRKFYVKNYSTNSHSRFLLHSSDENTYVFKSDDGRDITCIINRETPPTAEDCWDGDESLKTLE